MKKVFSLCLTTLLFMGMFVVNASAKTVLSVEKQWAVAAPGAGAARQGFGMEGALYYHKQGDGVYKVTSATTPAELVISKDSTGIGAHAIAKDDAGNIVLFGSASFPTDATTENFIYILRKGDSIGTKIASPTLDGFDRTDFIAASGDVFGTDGGHMYLINNNGAAAFDVLIKDGEATVTKFAGMTLGGQQNCMMLKDGATYYYASASKGIYTYDGTTATLVSDLTDLNTQCVGATRFMLAGKEIFVYHVGANYTSEIKVFNKTDNEFLKDKDGNTSFIPNTNAASGGALRGVWTNAERIDDNNYMLYVWHSHDGGAVYKVSAVVSAEVALSCNEEQGSVTGGGDLAVGANATVEAVAKPGFEFVCWLNGTDTVATTAKYTFPVTEDVALTAIFETKANVTITLAVNNAELGSITLPEGIQMGANDVVYGTPITLTAVPAEGKTFAGWFEGENLYSAEYTIELNSKANLSLTAKFVNVLVVAYELNGGVTNANGWKSKAHMALDLQVDFNAAYNTSKAWAKEENGVIYYYVNGEWQLPEAVQGLSAEAPNFIQQVTYNTSNNLVTLLHTEKWLVLMNYIDTLRVQAGFAVADEGALRADVSGFFLCSPAITDYRHTNNYAIAGTEEAFLGKTKMAFDNPTEIVTEVALNAPYKEGFTFDGWYAAADFSGEKITKLDPETAVPGGKLYAKWIEYIPTIEEIVAMPENTVTKAKGVVTYVSGKNAYIQDATGGMLLYASSDFTFQKGQSVIVSGKRTVYGGAPELKEVEEVSAEAGVMPKPTAFATIAPLKAEALKYFGQLVSFKGLTIVALDSYKNPSLTDGADTIACYKMSVNDALFPVGTKVDVTAIAGYFNGVQLVGDPAGITEVSAAGKESYTYPALGENGEYTLTNKWIFSNVQDNFASNMPAAIDHARGMVAKDGKMYFIDNNGGGIAIMGNGQFVVVDGATGKMLAPIKITGNHLFETEVVTDSATMAKEWKMAATLSFNDVKLDQAGHFLIAGCVSGGQRFQVYKVDIATGAATVVVDDRLYDYPDFELEGQATAWRFDAFNVYGDVDNHAIIMAADANSFFAYKWEIKNGVAGEAQRINCTPEGTDVSLIVKDGAPSVSAFGTAPQIFPVDFNYFYVDGWNTLPMLFDMEGALVEDFATVPTGVSVPMPGDTCVMNTGHNGLCEFQVGDEYYLLMAATNTVGSPTSAFALYKFADENKKFSEMTPMWFFPHEGMGAATNGCRTAVPTVEVKDNIATLYIYTNNNGYGVYEMTGVKGGDAVENVGMDAAIKAEKRIENGMLYIIRNGVRYTAQGVVAQ